MKLTVCGHSVSHPRQHRLFSYMGAADLVEVQVLAPSRWGNEHCTTVSSHGYQCECLEPIGQQMNTFRLRGLEGYIEEYVPNVLYIMEEPYTPFALQCTMIAEKLNIPTAVFTWENVLDRHVDKYHDDIEKDVTESASVLIAGNEGAKARLIHRGAAEDKIAVCPQTGIDCELFKQMPEIERIYDLAYFGRMVKEKGVDYIEKVAEELKMKMLWIGGRGTMTPSYGDYIGWVDYLKLPEYYNKLLMFVTYPYGFNGYSEQMNFTIGEAMACGTPVVSSSNGSICEVYKDAPILYVGDANEEALSHAITYMFRYPVERRIEQGLKWVHEHLSVPIIARRVVDILENARK